MKWILIFKLDDPNKEKWELWKGLSAHSDKICRTHGLINNSRKFCNRKYLVEVHWSAPDAEAIFKCQYEMCKLETKHGVPSTCISAEQIQSPEVTNIQLKLQLCEEQRTTEFFNIWCNLAKTIDAETRRHNILVKRTENFENFSMHLKVSFINHFDWSYISYFAGNACGKAGLELLHYETVIDPQTEDILDQLNHITRKHRQLSLFPELKRA